MCVQTHSDRLSSLSTAPQMSLNSINNFSLVFQSSSSIFLVLPGTWCGAICTLYCTYSYHKYLSESLLTVPQFYPVRDAFQKKIAEKETLVHMGGRGVKKSPFFGSSKRGHIFMGGGVKIFLSHVPCSLLCFCFHTI